MGMCVFGVLMERSPLWGALASILFFLFVPALHVVFNVFPMLDSRIEKT